MTKLSELAAVLKSKNSKAFLLCFDVVFFGQEDYLRVKKSGVINKKLISKLYKTHLDNILLTWYDASEAFKITIPRPVIKGEPDDGDILGGQFYPLLSDIEVP